VLSDGATIVKYSLELTAFPTSCRCARGMTSCRLDPRKRLGEREPIASPPRLRSMPRSGCA
jgi:hypothetical protein